jgi:hypothetical protein
MKPDSQQITDFLKGLSNAYRLGRVSSKLAEFVYHHTDVQNAVEILNSGQLLCRSELERLNRMPVDNASRTVIANTNSSIKDFVRLYFRPKTPTQYRNEGIRPIGRRWEDAHSPVPIFFLFDAVKVLTMDSSLFSERNLAKHGETQLYSTGDELAQFDFGKIFHSGGLNHYSQEDKQSIIACRNAEVVVPHNMDLSPLRLVICRSPAEKETLLNLLSYEAFDRWASKIMVDTKADLFFREWSFVQSANLSSTSAMFEFSPETSEPGPFQLTITAQGNTQQIGRRDNFYANSRIKFNLGEPMWKYEVRLKLDDSLAYVGTFDGDLEIPF